MKRLQYCKNVFIMTLMMTVATFMVMIANMHPLLNILTVIIVPVFCTIWLCTSTYQRMRDIDSDNYQMLFLVMGLVLILFPPTILYPMLAPSDEDTL